MIRVAWESLTAGGVGERHSGAVCIKRKGLQLTKPDRGRSVAHSAYIASFGIYPSCAKAVGWSLANRQELSSRRSLTCVRWSCLLWRKALGIGMNRLSPLRTKSLSCPAIVFTETIHSLASSLNRINTFIKSNLILLKDLDIIDSEERDSDTEIKANLTDRRFFLRRCDRFLTRTTW